MAAVIYVGIREKLFVLYDFGYYNTKPPSIHLDKINDEQSLGPQKECNVRVQLHNTSEFYRDVVRLSIDFRITFPCPSAI